MLNRPFLILMILTTVTAKVARMMLKDGRHINYKIMEYTVTVTCIFCQLYVHVYKKQQNKNSEQDIQVREM